MSSKWDNYQHEYKNWGIVRFATFDDTDLCHVIQLTENKYGEIKQIIYMGENPTNERIYQIIYRKR